MKTLGRKIAATVTRVAVRCSAWLGDVRFRFFEKPCPEGNEYVQSAVLSLLGVLLGFLLFILWACLYPEIYQFFYEMCKRR